MKTKTLFLAIIVGAIIILATSCGSTAHCDAYSDTDQKNTEIEDEKS